MSAFLESLFTTGDVVIAAEISGDHGTDSRDHGTDSRDSRTDDLRTLCRYESVWRTQQPLNSPEFLMDPALKAARILETACLAVMRREIGVEQVHQRILKSALNPSNDAGDHYSVDLVLRFLPQVADRAARISESDPLLEVFRTVARPWPLSSIGMKACEPDQLPGAFQNPSLWRMYVDRVISQKDMSRLNIPSVREAVAAAIGPFRMLAPGFVV